MVQKISYKTKQKEELLSYLETIPGVHFTAADISDHFRAQGKSIGITTIYRQLDRLVEEGQVSKYYIDESSSACFEYIDPENNCHHPHCYHCKCERCGKLIHLDCHEMEGLLQHISKEHRFLIDPMRTVFYGLCADCQKGDIHTESNP
ncbi:MAG: transcriptional repressor [Lachnospiraceae bacterium]|nr:transcriptional repressor [Lachnospiraceae bacterium]